MAGLGVDVERVRPGALPRRAAGAGGRLHDRAIRARPSRRRPSAGCSSTPWSSDSGTAPLAWRPGAQALLREARDLGLPTALVSASWARLIEAVEHRIDDELGTDAFDVVDRRRRRPQQQAAPRALPRRSGGARCLAGRLPRAGGLADRRAFGPRGRVPCRRHPAHRRRGRAGRTPGGQPGGLQSPRPVAPRGPLTPRPVALRRRILEPSGVDGHARTRPCWTEVEMVIANEPQGPVQPSARTSPSSVRARSCAPAVDS